MRVFFDEVNHWSKTLFHLVSDKAMALRWQSSSNKSLDWPLWLVVPGTSSEVCMHATVPRWLMPAHNYHTSNVKSESRMNFDGKFYYGTHAERSEAVGWNPYSSLFCHCSRWKMEDNATALLWQCCRQACSGCFGGSILQIGLTTDPMTGSGGCLLVAGGDASPVERPLVFALTTEPLVADCVRRSTFRRTLRYWNQRLTSVRLQWMTFGQVLRWRKRWLTAWLTDCRQLIGELRGQIDCASITCGTRRWYWQLRWRVSSCHLLRKPNYWRCGNRISSIDRWNYWCIQIQHQQFTSRLMNADAAAQRKSHRIILL